MLTKLELANAVRADLSAVSPNDISVKLRFAETNAKLSRTPANIESAITALSQELLDLYGPEGLYHVTGAIAQIYAADRDLPATTESVVACATELLVNMTLPAEMNEPAAFIATRVIAEFENMELIEASPTQAA